MPNITRLDLTFTEILLNIKENSIKQDMDIKIKIHNQQMLGHLWQKKVIRRQKKLVKKHKNGKIIYYIHKVKK